MTDGILTLSCDEKGRIRIYVNGVLMLERLESADQFTLHIILPVNAEVIRHALKEKYRHFVVNYEVENARPD